MRNEASTPNWALLAAIRFFLAMVVLITHLDLFQTNETPFLFIGNFGAFAAVCGFLAISGFSIRHSLVTNPKGFFLRRFIRIYPLYFSVLLLGLLPYLSKGNAFSGTLVSPTEVHAHAVTPVQLLANLLLLCGLTVRTLPTIAPAWTLACEVVFYLCSPLLLKLPRNYVLGLMVFSMGAYCLAPSEPHFAVQVGLLKLPCLIGFYLLGWLIREGIANAKERLLLFLLPIFALGHNNQGIKEGIFLLTFCVAVLMYQDELRIPAQFRRIATYAGELSYPLYLAHLPIFWLVWSVWGIDSGPVLFVAALLFAIVLYHVIDHPIRSWTRGRKPQRNDARESDLILTQAEIIKAPVQSH